MRSRHVIQICAAVLLGSLVIVLAVVLSRSSSSDSASAGTNESASSANATVTGNDTDNLTGSSSSASSASWTGEHVQWSIRNGTTKSRGVNLGGWLVAEYWMTQDTAFWASVEPSDRLGGEYIAITGATSPSVVRAGIKTHHSTFITEDDVKEIAAAGFNTVRVPIGWWILGRDDYDTSNSQRWRVFPTDTLDRLDLLITKWAKTHNVAVLISMHAAKGSQNGEQHSAPTDLGESYWSAYPENVANTLEVVTFLANRYKDEDAFLGFTLLNGPAGTTDEATLLAYYTEAYDSIRGRNNDCVLSVMAVSYGQGELSDFLQGATNVWVEWHPYFAFGYDDYSDAKLLAAVTGSYQELVKSWNGIDGHNPLFIGEWSVAVPAGQFSGNADAFYTFAADQFAVIAQAEAGWSFFSWKTSGDYSGWSMKELLTDSKLRALLEQNLKT